MILAPFEYSFSFKDYGLNIPLDDRIPKIMDYLQKRYYHQLDTLFFPIPTDIAAYCDQDLLLAHTPDYVKELWGPNLNEVIRVCFELEQYGMPTAGFTYGQLRDALLLQAAFTFKAMQISCEKGFCYYLGGGMHHALSNQGRGFCLVNDIVIGLKKLLAAKKIQSAWVIDLDAHKGDGTAELTCHDQRILTLSIHMAEGWPLSFSDKNDPAFLSSNIDIPISEGQEMLYLDQLSQGLERLAQIHPQKPDLAIVVDGADPYLADELPSSALLKLTLKQLLKRDKLVYRFLENRSIAQTWLMGGGYGKNTHKVYLGFLEWLIPRLLGR